MIERVDHARPRRRARDGRGSSSRSACSSRCSALGLWIWPPGRGPARSPVLAGNESVPIFGVNVTLARRHRLRRRRSASPSGCGCCSTAPGPASTCGPRSTAGRWPCCTAPGPTARRCWPGPSAARSAALAGDPRRRRPWALSHVNLTLLIVNAYAAAMIGRLRSLPMTFVGAVLLGLADSYAIGYLPDRATCYWSHVPLRHPGRRPLRRAAGAAAAPQLRGHGTRTLARGRSRARPGGRRWLTAALVVGAPAWWPRDRSATPTRCGLRRSSARPHRACRSCRSSGFAGQVSLCQMSFAGIGALVMAHHGQGGNPIGAARGGRGRARPSARSSRCRRCGSPGIYLALATAAFAVFLDRWVFASADFDLGPLRRSASSTAASVAVDPLDVPGVDTTDRSAARRASACVFAVAVPRASSPCGAAGSASGCSP